MERLNCGHTDQGSAGAGDRLKQRGYNCDGFICSLFMRSNAVSPAHDVSPEEITSDEKKPTNVIKVLFHFVSAATPEPGQGLFYEPPAPPACVWFISLLLGRETEPASQRRTDARRKSGGSTLEPPDVAGMSD